MWTYIVAAMYAFLSILETFPEYIASRTDRLISQPLQEGSIKNHSLIVVFNKKEIVNALVFN